MFDDVTFGYCYGNDRVYDLFIENNGVDVSQGSLTVDRGEPSF